MFSTITMMMSASGGITIKENSTGKDEAEMEKVKLSSLPLYPPTDEYDYYIEAPSKLENLIRDTRIKLETLNNSYQPTFERVSHIYNTGIAHTNESLILLRDDANYLARIGVFTVSSVFGLVAARKGKFIKRLTYTSIGFGAAGALCYPERTRQIRDEGLRQAEKNAKIAYYFIVGSRPTVQNEDGKAFKGIATMASNVGNWGINLFKFAKPAPSSDKPAEKTFEKEELVKTTDLTNEQVATEPSAQLEIPAIKEPVKPETVQLEDAQAPDTQSVVEVTAEPSTSDNEVKTDDIATDVPVVTIAEDTSAPVETAVIVEVSETQVEDAPTPAAAVVATEIESIEEEKPVEVVVEDVRIIETDAIAEVSVKETEAVPEEEKPAEVIVETVLEVAATETESIEEEKSVEVVVEAVVDDTPAIVESDVIAEVSIKETEAVPEEEKLAEKPDEEDTPVIIETEVIHEVPTIETKPLSEVEKGTSKVQTRVVEADFGQGYAEDKAMYTTRD